MSVASDRPSGGKGSAGDPRSFQGTATVKPESVGLLERRTWEVELLLGEDLPAGSVLYFCYHGMQREIPTLQNGAPGEDGYWEVEAPDLEFEAAWVQLTTFELVRVTLKSPAPQGGRLCFKVLDIPHRREKDVGRRVHAWDGKSFPVFLRRPEDERLHGLEHPPAAQVQPEEPERVRACWSSTVTTQEALEPLSVKLAYFDGQLNPVNLREANLVKLCECGRHPFHAQRAEGVLLGDVPACDCGEITIQDADYGMTCTLNPQWRIEPGDARLFWGEIHSHGCFDDGARGLDYNFRFAHDTACLDFASATALDHFAGMRPGVLSQYSNAMRPFAEAFGCEWEEEFRSISDRLLGVPEGRTRWEHIRAKTDQHNEPGRFVTLLGYEWAASRYAYLEKADGVQTAHGHRCVYFNVPDPPLFSARDQATSTPEGLFAALEPYKGRALTVPHHPAAHPEHAGGGWTMHWRQCDPEFDRLVEVFSCYGSSEYPGNPRPIPGKCGPTESFVRSAIAQGVRLGIIAGTDNHEGRPGQADGGWGDSPGGMIGVWATELTRDAIFEALYNRRCYGVSNMARIILDVRLNGAPMGSELDLEPGAPRQISIRAQGTTAIADIQIIKNGRAWRAYRSSGSRFECTQTDDEPPAQTDSYYVTVFQNDGEMAWSSPIWVHHAEKP